MFLYSSYCVIVQVRVVLKTTVVDDWHLDNLSERHLQSLVNSICLSVLLAVNRPQIYVSALTNSDNFWSDCQNFNFQQQFVSEQPRPLAALTCFPGLQYGLLACVRADVSFPFPGGEINKRASKRVSEGALLEWAKNGRNGAGSPAVLFPWHAFFETVTINYLHLVIFRVPSSLGGGGGEGRTRGGGVESVWLVCFALTVTTLIKQIRRAVLRGEVETEFVR